MSSYISTLHGCAAEDQVDWARLTRQRLSWLYGPDYDLQRASQTQADLAAWNALGRREAA